MLASLSSILPSSHHSSQNDQISSFSRPTINDGDDDDDDNEIMTADDLPLKKKDKKEKHPNETFIFVRPPPSKSNHPLNLQVQMVPPRPPNPTTGSHQSVDFHATYPQPETPTTSETITTHRNSISEHPPITPRTPSTDLTLTRTSSNRSDASMYTSSVASFSSFSSTASGRRTIIPLYNLQAHNVMTNIIVDAGTDAKIAKFQKRGMELIGLAVIEPVEVWPSHPSQKESHESSLLHPPPHRSSASSRPVTPEVAAHSPPSSSVVSLSSASHSHAIPHQRQQTTESIDPQPAAPSMPTRKRDIFGKLFKKKEHPSQEPVDASAPHTRAPSIPHTSRFTRHFKRPSFTGAALTVPALPTDTTHIGVVDDDSSNHDHSNTGNANSTGTSSSLLCPPILGIQPTMSSPVVPPVGRPSMYVWYVRRWIKGADAGLLSGMIGKLGPTGSAHANGGRSVEVRFEWKKGRPDKGKKKKGRARTNSLVGDATHSRRASLVGASSSNAASTGSTASLNANGKPGHLRNKAQNGHKGENEHERERKRANRLSVASQKSISTSVTSDDRFSERSREHKAQGEQPEDGEESDPEDSETPWTCTLKVRRLVPVSSPRTPTPATPYTAGGGFKGVGGGVEDQTIRVKIGTLSQTPHHPKVVAMLKVPFPLPDVEVDALSVHKRVVLPGGIVVKTVNGEGNDEGGGGGGGVGLVLTAEEIKDVVSSTGLWLVVREGFGGVGKVNRKGDGWRIRA